MLISDLQVCVTTIFSFEQCSFSHALMNFSELNFQQAARRRRIHAPCEGLGRSAGAPLILGASRIICRVCVGCECTAGLQTPLRIVSNIVFGKQSTCELACNVTGVGVVLVQHTYSWRSASFVVRSCEAERRTRLHSRANRSDWLSTNH